MHVFSTALFLILALAGISCAAPLADEEWGGTEMSTTQPDYFCAHTYKTFYTRFILRGRMWPYDEHAIKKAIKATPGCVMSVWRYRDWQEDGLNNFDLTFHMPVLCEDRVTSKLQKLVGPSFGRKQGIQCPSIKVARKLHELQEDLGTFTPDQYYVPDEDYQPGPEDT